MRDQSEVAEDASLARLLRASADGDRDAFARVYEKTAPRLFPVALRLLRRRDAAEDVLQEAYVQIWRKAGQYDFSRGRPLAWMATIVRNRAIDRLRALARDPSDPSPWEEAAENLADRDAEMHTGSNPDSLAIRRCLERLQDKQRESILLAFYHGLTHEELAARLAAPLGTVKSWVRRGLLELKDCLEA